MNPYLPPLHCFLRSRFWDRNSLPFLCACRFRTVICCCRTFHWWGLNLSLSVVQFVSICCVTFFHHPIPVGLLCRRTSSSICSFVLWFVGFLVRFFFGWYLVRSFPLFKAFRTEIFVQFFYKVTTQRVYYPLSHTCVGWTKLGSWVGAVTWTAETFLVPWHDNECRLLMISKQALAAKKWGFREFLTMARLEFAVYSSHFYGITCRKNSRHANWDVEYSLCNGRYGDYWY